MDIFLRKICNCCFIGINNRHRRVIKPRESPCIISVKRQITIRSIIIPSVCINLSGARHHLQIQTRSVSNNLLSLTIFYNYLVVILWSFYQFNRCFSILRIYSNRINFVLSFKIRSHREWSCIIYIVTVIPVHAIRGNKLDYYIIFLIIWKTVRGIIFIREG